MEGGINLVSPPFYMFVLHMHSDIHIQVHVQVMIVDTHIHNYIITVRCGEWLTGLVYGYANGLSLVHNSFIMIKQ
jgi:hypothetical protein